MFCNVKPPSRRLALGTYGLSFSPDGRLLYGATNFPEPGLEVLDFNERKLVRQFHVTAGTRDCWRWSAMNITSTAIARKASRGA